MATGMDEIDAAVNVWIYDSNLQMYLIIVKT